MADVFFVIRTFLVTVALFLAMQIRVGSRTVEQQSVAWLHSSSFVEALQNVSEGAVHVVHVASRKVVTLFTHEEAREVKHKAARRAEMRKVMTRNAVVMENRAVPKQVPREAAQQNAMAQPETGAFRSFFDVKTVHDVESN